MYKYDENGKGVFYIEYLGDILNLPKEYFKNILAYTAYKIEVKKYNESRSGNGCVHTFFTSADERQHYANLEKSFFIREVWNIINKFKNAITESKYTEINDFLTKARMECNRIGCEYILKSIPKDILEEISKDFLKETSKEN